MPMRRKTKAQRKEIRKNRRRKIGKFLLKGLKMVGRETLKQLPYVIGKVRKGMDNRPRKRGMGLKRAGMGISPSGGALRVAGGRYARPSRQVRLVGNRR